MGVGGPVFKFLSRSALVGVVLLVVVGGTPPVRAQQAPRRSFAVGATFLAAGEPLNSSAGLTLHYTHAFGRSSGKQPPVMKFELAGYSLDRDADDAGLEGSLDVIQISGGVGWPLIRGESRWGLAIGGGLDFFVADGKGGYAEADPIALRNSYDVDPGVGLHAGLDLTLRIGGRWKLFVDLRYLAAELNGDQIFVIDDVSGTAQSVTFDLGGTQGAIGFGYRF